MNPGELRISSTEGWEGGRRRVGGGGTGQVGCGPWCWIGTGQGGLQRLDQPVWKPFDVPDRVRSGTPLPSQGADDPNPRLQADPYD